MKSSSKTWPVRTRALITLRSRPVCLSSVMGDGALVALVLLVTWVMFMTFVYPTHYPEVSEDLELALYETMFSRWAWTALLAMAFVAVDAICRLVSGVGSSAQRLSVDLSAMVLLTMMMVTNIQFSRVYSYHHWERTNPYLGTYEVPGEFARESFSLPVTVVEARWDDYLSWVSWEAAHSRTVRLELVASQSVQCLSQCTTAAWGSGIKELRFRLAGDEDHRLTLPWSWHWMPAVLVPSQDGDLSKVRLVDDLTYRRFQDQIAPGEVVEFESWLDPMPEDKLDQFLEDSARHRPVPILVPRDASMEWLDALLDQLEERGAEYFTLVFHG